MSADSFDHKILLVVRNQEEGKKINMVLSSAGMKECEPEVVDTNIVVRLQDRSYVGCIISYGAVTKLTGRVIENLRANALSSQIPIIVLAPDQDWEIVRTLYDAGANYVVRRSIVDEARDVAWILDSLIRYAAAFKVGRERFNR